MLELSTQQKVTALSTLRKVSMGDNGNVLMETVFKLLVVAVTQLESRVIALEMKDAYP